MAREYGKVYMSIWGDKDFTSLPGEAQRMYLFLVSQPDLSRAGTITLALNRWASRTGNYDRETILEHLAILARRQFIVVDEMAEELLVRSYVRHDEGWKSPNIMISIAAAARQVMSETLRAVIRHELARIDTSGLPARVNEKTGRSTREFIDYQIKHLSDGLASCNAAPDVMAWGDVPEGFPEGFGKGFPEGLKTSEIEPFPEGFPEGSLTATTTTTATTTATTTTTADSAGFTDFWAAYPKRADKGHARTAWAKAVRSANVSDILDGARRYAADPNLPEPQFIPMAATWLNGERWDDGPLPSRNGRPVDRQADLLRSEMVKAVAADARNEQRAQRLEIGA